MESKLAQHISSKPRTGDELARSHSADKFESLMCNYAIMQKEYKHKCQKQIKISKRKTKNSYKN